MLKPRESIAGLSPYQSPIVSRDGLSLDLNESMAGCSPRVLARLRSLSAADVSLYPEREVGERLVANFLGVAPEQVLLTNGMDEALSLLFATYLAPGDELLFADPTFVMYPMLGEALGAQVVRVQSGEDLALPVADLLADFATHAGDRDRESQQSHRPRRFARRLAEDCGGGARCGGADRRSLLRVLRRNAAPRLGAPSEPVRRAHVFQSLRTRRPAPGRTDRTRPEQIGYLRRFSLPFNVNSVVLACLEEALADQAFVRDHVAQVKQGRERLAQLFDELGLRFWPSQTNFVLVRVGAVRESSSWSRCGGAAFWSAIRPANPGCEGCVRITVGTPSQMDGVLQAIREAIAETRVEGDRAGRCAWPRLARKGRARHPSTSCLAGSGCTEAQGSGKIFE